MSDATADNVVDYDDVISRYEASLNTMLRGFRGGARFLENWVHDPEHAKSILNMIEAARTGGLAEVTILLGTATLASVEIGSLRALAAPLGTVETVPSDKALALKVVFGAGSGGGSSRGAEAHARAQRAREERDARLRASAMQAAAAGGGGDELPSFYGAGVQAILRQPFTHEGSLPAAAGEQVALQAQAGAVRLAVLIDAAEHTVRAARHSGATDPQQRALLERLCGIMEDKPLLECADHAVVRLEYGLRDRSSRRPVAGILTPESTPAFRGLASLVRDLLAQYRARTGFDEVRNRWDPPPAPAWREATHGQRLLKLQAALDELSGPLGLAAGDVVCTRLDKNTRVTVEFHVELTTAQKPLLLRALESGLKQAVEPTLHLYQEEMHDKNKLRRL
jgi:hypothetical protein